MMHSPKKTTASDPSPDLNKTVSGHPDNALKARKRQDALDKRRVSKAQFTKQANTLAALILEPESDKNIIKISCDELNKTYDALTTLQYTILENGTTTEIEDDPEFNNINDYERRFKEICAHFEKPTTNKPKTSRDISSQPKENDASTSRKKEDGKDEMDDGHSETYHRRQKAIDEREVQMSKFYRTHQMLIDELEGTPNKYKIETMFSQLELTYHEIMKAQDKILTNRSCLNLQEDEEFEATNNCEHDFIELSASIKAFNASQRTKTEKSKPSKPRTSIKPDDLYDDKYSDLMLNSGDQSDEDLATGTPKKEDTHIYALVGMNFDIQKEVRQFAGDRMTYKTFKTSFERASQKMETMGRSKSDRLIALKKCLTNRPYDLIKALPDIDENYDVALAELDRIYLDNSIFTQDAINKLLDNPKMMDSPDSLAKGHTTIIQATQTLKGLGLSKEAIGDLIIMTICERILSDEVRALWEKRKLSTKDTSPIGHKCNLQDLLNNIQDHIKIKECVHRSKTLEQRRDDTRFHPDRRPQKIGAARSYPTAPNSFNTAYARRCKFCNSQEHVFLLHCEKFRQLTPENKYDKVQMESLCWLCFETNHGAYNCRHYKTWHCSQCKSQTHNTLFHDALQKQRQERFHRNQSNSYVNNDEGHYNGITNDEIASQDIHNSCIATGKGNATAILQTVKAWAVAEDGSRQMVRVFLDSGSELNLISRHTAEELGLDGKRSTLSLTVTGGEETHNKDSKLVKFKLASLDGRYLTDFIEANTIDKVTSNLRPVPIKPENYPHLKDIFFNEQFPRGETQVNIMLGEPWYSELMCGATVSGKLGQPVAIPTKLGYILGGSFPSQQQIEQRHYTTSHCSIKKVDLDDFWKTEHIGITEKVNEEFTIEEQQACDLMEKNTIYDQKNQKWTTTLLFKNEQTLPSGYGKALAIAKKVESDAIKKNRQDEINKVYNEFLKEDFAEEVTHSKTYEEKVHYLPTHTINRPEASSTKIRVVMNAASKSKDGTSLNSLLHTGPNMLPDYLGLIMDFRRRKYVYVTDICKMFLRIGIHKGRDCLRYLWRNCNVNEDFKTFRMKAMAFGIATAPFQANWILKKHAEMCDKEYPLGSKALKEKFYADNGISGTDDLNTAKMEISQLQQVLQKASMPTHKWTSNNKELLEDLPEDILSPPGPQSLFGITWDPEKDTLKINFTPIIEEIETETKRTLAAQMAKVFDPLGLVAPFLLKAKLLFQDIWAEKIDWDDQLPSTIDSKWRAWKNEIQYINNVDQPRCLVDQNKKIKNQSVIGFGDASNKAYGTCIYLKTDYEDGSTTTNLIFAKTRIAPLPKDGKNLSIVRLELLGMLITARASVYVSSILQLPITAAFTDSQVNLARIQRGYKPFKTWVGTRIKEILELIRVDKWKFVPGAQNPADLASRGCDAKILRNSEIWWNGPKFLTLTLENWPTEPINLTNEKLENTQEDPELKKLLPSISATKLNDGFILGVVNRFETWEKLLRFSSYILRLGSSQHKKYQKKPITVAELHQTELFWMRKAQEMNFKNELNTLTNTASNETATLLKKSPLRDYNPQYDNNQKMIYSESRLVQSSLPGRQTRPWIIPKNNDIVKKYVLFLHRTNGHSGPDYTLSLLRRNYQLCNARKQIRAILKLCTTPRCKKPIQLGQMMAPLPKERCDEPEIFRNVAIDLFGPMIVHHRCEMENCPHEKQTEKSYGCIFTCYHSRAIHLELVKDASAEAFLDALRKFTSRRGTPSLIFSDNGRNFVKAEKEIRQLYRSINWETVAEKTRDKGIEWIFNVSKASHMNGLAERLIQSLKKPLRIILGTNKLTYYQLDIVLTEVEAIINNRPITFVSEDSNTMNALTPAQLMYGKNFDLLLDPNQKMEESTKLNYAEMWRKRKLISNQFWKIWQSSYLMNLQPRKKWRIPQPQDLQDKLVLIKDDNMSKNTWKVGRIIKQYYSNDGLVRSVDLKTATGQLTRPVNKLALLETEF